MTPASWIGPTPAGELLATLADGAVRSSALLLAALAAERLLRHRSAAARHAALATALLAAPVLLLATALRPDTIWLSSVGPDLANAIAALYFAGVAVTLAPLGRGLLALAALSRGATDAPSWLHELRPSGARLKAADVAVPMTFGWLRPVVLFPRMAGNWTAQERSSAHLHELGHVRRRDWLVQLASHLALASLWFNPLVWVVRRRMLLQAEHAADDAVLAAGVQPSAYASHLLRRCRELRPVQAAAVSMAPRGPRQLERRVRAILAPHRARRSSPVLLGAALLAVTALSLSIATASVIPSPEPAPAGCDVNTTAGDTSEAPWAPRDPSPMTGPATRPPPGPSDYEPISMLPEITPTLQALLAEVRGLPLMELDVQQQAAQVIARNCPYRRGGIQLLAAMRHDLAPLRVDRTPAEFVDAAPELFERLAGLEGFLDMHWAYIEALDLHPLPTLRAGDYLYAHRPKRPTEAQADPKEAVRAAASRVRDLVRDFDQATQDKLEVAGAQLGPDGRDLLISRGVFNYLQELNAVDLMARTLRVAASQEGAEPLPPGMLDHLLRMEKVAVELWTLLEAYDQLGC